MLKNRMTLDEMLQYLNSIGYDTFYFDQTIVQEIACAELGYEIESMNNKITFIKSK